MIPGLVSRGLLGGWVACLLAVCRGFCGTSNIEACVRGTVIIEAYVLRVTSRLTTWSDHHKH